MQKVTNEIMALEECKAAIADPWHIKVNISDGFISIENLMDAELAKEAADMIRDLIDRSISMKKKDINKAMDDLFESFGMEKKEVAPVQPQKAVKEITEVVKPDEAADEHVIIPRDRGMIKYCQICGKELNFNNDSPYNVTDWAYKLNLGRGHKTKFFCSYNHMRQYEREHE